SLATLGRVERFFLEPGDRAEELALAFGRRLVELAAPLAAVAELLPVLRRRHDGDCARSARPSPCSGLNESPGRVKRRATTCFESRKTLPAHPPPADAVTG